MLRGKKVRDFQDLASSKKFDKVKKLLEELNKEYEVSSKDLLKEIEKEKIPLTIFIEDLSPFETIVKYLKENLGYNNKKISLLLNRSEKTTWQAYKSTENKYSKKLTPEKTSFFIPIDVLKDRSLSFLELVVSYLKEEYNLKYSQMAKIVKRDQRTVWTCYNRATKKRAANA